MKQKIPVVFCEKDGSRILFPTLLRVLFFESVLPSSEYLMTTRCRPGKQSASIKQISQFNWSLQYSWISTCSSSHFFYHPLSVIASKQTPIARLVTVLHQNQQHR